MIRYIKMESKEEEDIKKSVEKILRAVRTQVEIEICKKSSRIDREGRRIAWVKLGSVSEKITVMKEKLNLGKWRERIFDDLTEKERKIEWILKNEESRLKAEKMRLRDTRKCR